MRFFGRVRGVRVGRLVFGVACRPIWSIDSSVDSIIFRDLMNDYNDRVARASIIRNPDYKGDEV